MVLKNKGNQAPREAKSRNGVDVEEIAKQ